MSRKTARESAVRLIYEFCISGETNELSFRMLCGKSSQEDAGFTRGLCEGVEAHADFLRGIVARYSNDFAPDRVFKMDLAILLVASYELLYTDVPVAVAVNEALELSKIYSTDKSAAYINGVLASVIRDKKELLEDECQDN